MSARNGLVMLNTPKHISLADFDASDTDDMKKGDERGQLEQLGATLREQQDLLWGAAKQSVLIVLQGMDTAGKDGTISHVLASVNPVSCHVWSFRQPTAEELRHDFLWRIHQRTPQVGEMAVFNRSHYEDVLIVRVHELVSREIWQARYDEINEFERMLTHNGTILLKFFLNISKEEQEQRLLAREKDPSKAWKLSVGDWHEREYWDQYQQAYEDVLSRCSTKWAPWYVVPSDKKWYRNFVITQAIVERLAAYQTHWSSELGKRGEQALAELRAYRENQRSEAAG